MKKFDATGEGLVAGTALTLVAALFASGAAMAQSAAPAEEATAEEEVIVTSERRATSLLKTPAAVSAIGSDQLRTGSVQLLKDLAGLAPGLSLPNAYTNMQAIYIRGIGTNDPGTYGSVGVYIDDVYVPRTFGNGLFDLPDVERVEVLRGPQGTLYGQNTTAGAIRVISRTPGDEVTGYFSLEGGNYDAFRTQAYLSGPIIPGLLSGSIAYTHRQRDGYTFNGNLDKNVDAILTDQARAKLRFTPNDWLEVVFSVDGTRDRTDNANVVPLGLGVIDPRLTFSDDYPQKFRRDIAGSSLTATFQLNDALSFKSITAYRGFRDHPSPWDMDGTPEPRNGWVQVIDERQFTQEFQLQGDYGDLTFTVGALYFQESFDFNRKTWQWTVGAASPVYSETQSYINVRSIGVYGQASYQLTEALRITAGIRSHNETQEFDNASYRNDAAGERISTIYAVSGLEKDWSWVTPRIVVDYQWSPDFNTYVSWTQGTKSGGYSRSASTALIASVPVEPETVSTYEVGAKGRFLGGALQASFAGFYNRFEDYQASIRNPTINGVLLTGNVVANAASANTYGAELELTATPLEGLRIRATAAYLRSEFEEFANPTAAAASDYTGNELPFAPRWSLAANVSYSLPLEIEGDLRVFGNITYQTPTFLGPENSETFKVGYLTYVDIGADYTTGDGHWTFAALVKNVFDEAYLVGPIYANASLNQYAGAYSPPRFITTSIRYNF